MKHNWQRYSRTSQVCVVCGVVRFEDDDADEDVFVVIIDDESLAYSAGLEPPCIDD